MAAEFEVAYFDLNSNYAKVISKLPIENTSIADVSKKVMELTELTSDDFELYLGLKPLEKTSEELLLKRGVDSFTKIYAVKNKTANKENAKKEIPDIDQARSCLSRLSAMMRGSQKKNIIKTLQDESIMKPIIAATPNIQQDQITLDFLKKPSLFSIAINPTNTVMLVKEHPTFLMACMSIWHVIATEALQKVTLDESEDEMELDDSSQQPMETSSSGSTTTTSTSTSRAPIITPEQLAAAVQSAIQGAFTNNPSTSSTAVTGATGSSNATNQTNTPERRRPKEKISKELMQAGLKQLREMGLTDEMMCRRVLEATKGDVQAAITILFS